MAKYIVTHPDNIADLRTVSDALSLAHAGGFFGMKIVTNEYMARYCSEYRPPNTRLIEHEKSDEVWLKYFGMGRYVETKMPLFLQVTDDDLWPVRMMKSRYRISDTFV